MINTKVDDRQHAPNNLTNYYMIKLIQSLPSHLPTAGNYSHMRGEVMEGRWRGHGDDDGDDFPSPEAKTASRLALPRKNRGWRRLRGVDQKKGFYPGISSRRVKIGGQVGHQGVCDHPRRPPGT